MNTTNQYLDAVKARYGLASDYAIAKKLGISPQSVKNYRNGRTSMDENVSVLVADALKIDPEQVIIAAQIEREKKPELRAIWESIFRKVGGVAAASLLALGLVATPVDSYAGQFDNSKIMRKRKPRKKANPFSIIGQLSAIA